jgi:hypothetical protein
LEGVQREESNTLSMTQFGRRPGALLSRHYHPPPFPLTDTSATNFTSLHSNNPSNYFFQFVITTEINATSKKPGTTSNNLWNVIPILYADGRTGLILYELSANILRAFLRVSFPGGFPPK